MRRTLAETIRLRSSSLSHPPLSAYVKEPRISEVSVSPAALSLQHNFAWAFGGNVVYAACQWAVVVLLAKIGSTEMVGRFAFASAVTFPVALIANLKLRDVFITDLGNKYPFEEILGLRLALVVLATLTMLLICTVAHYGRGETSIIVVLGVAQLMDCISESYFGIMQRYERMDRISRSLMLRSILSVGALALLLYSTGSLLWGLSGFVFGRLVVLFAYDAAPNTFALIGVDRQVPWTLSPRDTLFQRLRPQWNPRNQLKMLWVALPLGLGAILVSVNGKVQRYVIQHHLGARELGIYSALSYIPQSCFMVASALGGATFARLAKLFFADDLSRYKLLLFKLMVICMAVGLAGLLGCVLFGRSTLTILYKPEYAQHVKLLIWLMGVGAVSCLAPCLGAALTATSQFRLQVPIFVAVTTTSLVASVMLIPQKGLEGAALAALISIIVQLFLTFYAIHWVLRNRPHDLKGNMSPLLRLLFQSHQ